MSRNNKPSHSTRAVATNLLVRLAGGEEITGRKKGREQDAIYLLKHENMIKLDLGTMKLVLTKRGREHVDLLQLVPKQSVAA